jgi:hypothetical protein
MPQYTPAHSSRVNTLIDANKNVFQGQWGTISRQERRKEFGPGNALYPTSQRVSET